MFAATFLDPARVTVAKSFVGTSRAQRDAIAGQLREADYRDATG